MLQAPFLSAFNCIGDRCEDTCCKTWSMQVDDATRARYADKAPELLADVVPDDTASGWIMRKDPQTGYCVRLQGGLCGIHQKHGDAMLGDACHFYPRVTRRLGEEVLMSATLSCPEVARLALFADTPAMPLSVPTPRLPHSLKDYLPEGMQPAEALSVHHAFLTACTEEDISAELILLRLARATRALALMEQKQWPLMAAHAISHADEQLPMPLINPSNPFNLLHMLCGLVVASRKPASERLMHTIRDMEAGLKASLDWQGVGIALTEGSAPAREALLAIWDDVGHVLYTPVLRRWLQVQISMGLHPFAGFGQTLVDRITLMGVRLATVKLALLAAHQQHGGALQNEAIVRVVQSIARVLDHLADPAFFMQICHETRWSDEAGLCGLMML